MPLEIQFEDPFKNQPKCLVFLFVVAYLLFGNIDCNDNKNDDLCIQPHLNTGERNRENKDRMPARGNEGPIYPHDNRQYGTIRDGHLRTLVLSGGLGIKDLSHRSYP